MRYVVGFLFSDDRKQVALIHKRRPGWQAGRLNGVGGKIESGETPAAAMHREFAEEAGVWGVQWGQFATLAGPNFVAHCFSAFSSDGMARLQSPEAERVDTYDVARVIAGEWPVIGNVPVMLALALDDSGIVKPVTLTDDRKVAA